MKVIIVAAALLLGTSLPAQPASAPAHAQSPHDRLFALFAASDAAELDRHPTAWLYRGDLSHAGELGDLFSDALDRADRAAVETDLTALAAIDRRSLPAIDQLAYDTFRFGRLADKRVFDDPVLATAYRVRPINHFGGFQLSFADMSSGQGAAPYKTAADYQAGLSRMGQYPAVVDRIIARFREGIRLGIVDTKLTTRNMIEQLDGQIAGGVASSTFLGPVKTFPDAIAATERSRFTTAYEAAVRDRILPATVRLRDFLRDAYLPAARAGFGLKYMKTGDHLYAERIARNTTLPLTAKEVHELGLREVARLRGDMQAAAAQAGFKGTLAQLFERMRTDKSFQPTSEAQLTALYAGIKARVEARLPEQFSTFPKAPLAIRPTPAYRAKTSAGGEYQEGTPDGSRPGIFYYNSYDLPSRYMWEAETLFLHEAEPGHHFQISLAQENMALPNFMRFGGNTAFVEGWALYAEQLWRELGMESDPWQRLGGLNDEMLRAMRLVVDTGIHAYGWSREQSIQYMLDNSPEAVTDATAEVERYIADPGQALAYKIGQLTISRLKAKAEAALGPKFDPREFHAQVLMTGSLPMPVLEAKIDAWIAARKG